MDYLFVLSGGFVIWVFLVRREWLIEGQSFKIILAISIVLFLAAIGLHFTHPARYLSSGALVAPLLTLGLFRLFRRVFLLRFKREPKDVFLNWEAGLGPEKAFDFLYFMLGMLLLMFLPFVMQQLAKAGW
jgi:hypothetical protein